MEEQAKLQELNQRIDEVLYYIWDPIGVAKEPCARGEYQSYVKVIMEYVLKEDVNQIANQLSIIASDLMGLKSNIIHNLKVAEILIDYKYAVGYGLK